MNAPLEGSSDDRVGWAARSLLFAFAAFTALAVLTMYVLAEDTHRFFAWTIDPPITAAFLGAGYGAGLIAVVVSLRRGHWADVRIGLEAILVFVIATTVATLLHLDRFHFDADGIPLAAAWIWVLAYLAVPVWIVIALVQTRVPGRWAGPATWSRAAAGFLVAQGVVLAGSGVSLFAAPRTATWLWPWTLTPLTARAVAAWLLALGVAALVAARERALTHLEVPAAIYATTAVLQGAAMVRFTDQIDWGRPAAWVLVLLLVAMVTTGIAGSVAARRTRARAAR